MVSLNFIIYILTVDSKGLAPVAQEFMKKGCPTALRGAMYQHILGSHIAKEVKVEPAINVFYLTLFCTPTIIPFNIFSPTF